MSQSTVAKPSFRTVPRACRNCRTRKIRCDRRSPCSNCTTLSITCHSSPSMKQSQPEMNHDERHDRNYEGLLRRVTALERATKASAAQGSLCPNLNQQKSSDQSDTVSLVSLEGASSFSKQADLAARMVQRGIIVDTQNEDLNTHLTTLSNILQDQDVHESVSATAQPMAGVVEEGDHQQHPPSQFVVRVLNSITDANQTSVVYRMIQDHRQLEDICRKVYFPIHPVSIGELTLLNAMLFALLSDPGHSRIPGISAEEQEKYKMMCEQVFLAGVERYETHVLPTYEHVVILAIAGTRAQHDGSLFLQWKFASTAARHCLALGYHREEIITRMPAPESLRKRRLFWAVYFLDRSLVLTLGRAPTIQDYDVDLRPLPKSEEPGCRPWDERRELFLELARIQAQIYERIYSPGARQHCSNNGSLNNSTIVDELSKKLSDWHEHWHRVDGTRAHNKAAFDLIFAPVDIVYYATLAILFRGANLSTTASKLPAACYEAARRSLDLSVHLFRDQATQDPRVKATHAVWVHVYATFAPFVITFLSTIITQSKEDLSLLSTSLDMLRENSELVGPCKRIYTVCKCLYNMAHACTFPREESQPIISEQRAEVSQVQSFYEDLCMQPENDILSFALSFQASNSSFPDLDQIGQPLDPSSSNFVF